MPPKPSRRAQPAEQTDTNLAIRDNSTKRDKEEEYGDDEDDDEYGGDDDDDEEEHGDYDDDDNDDDSPDDDGDSPDDDDDDSPDDDDAEDEDFLSQENRYTNTFIIPSGEDELYSEWDSNNDPDESDMDPDYVEELKERRQARSQAHNKRLLHAKITTTPADITKGYTERIATIKPPRIRWSAERCFGWPAQSTDGKKIMSLRQFVRCIRDSPESQNQKTEPYYRAMDLLQMRYPWFINLRNVFDEHFTKEREKFKKCCDEGVEFVSSPVPVNQYRYMQRVHQDQIYCAPCGMLSVMPELHHVSPTHPHHYCCFCKTCKRNFQKAHRWFAPSSLNLEELRMVFKYGDGID